MPITLYDMSIPIMLKYLHSVSAILEKAAIHYPNATDQRYLLASRLVADMEPLSFQVHIIRDTCKELANHVCKANLEKLPNNMTSFSAVQERIANGIKLLESIEPAILNAAEDQEIVLSKKSGDLRFTSISYIQTCALPNFWFHINMVYALVRQAGVPVGKWDYLGTIGR